MIFSEQKFGGLMTVAMRREDAKKWFLGIDPPDLSTHVARNWLSGPYMSSLKHFISMRHVHLV